MNEQTRACRRTVDALYRALRSDTMIKLAWGTLALFAATLALKFEYLRSAYQGKGISFIVTEMSKGNDLPALLIAMQIISQDVLEVILLGSLTLLLVRATPRAARPATYIAVSAFLLALLGLNHLSFTEIGTFASYETLVTAVVFVTSYGTMAANYFTPKTAAFFAIGMMCITFSPTTFWLCSRRPLLARAQAALPVLGLAAALVCAALSALASLVFPSGPFPLRGAWSRMAQAAFAYASVAYDVKLASDPSQLVQAYTRLVTFDQGNHTHSLLAPRLEERIRPRHVLVVGLETAPRAYYPLTSGSPDLPAFRRMTSRAIVNEHHYTNSPFTRVANFSMLSGLYPPNSGLPSRMGHISCNALGSTLRDRGYRTHYIDSWVLDWLPGSGERRQAHDLGFELVTDRKQLRDDGSFEQLLAAEASSFDLAFESIVQAHHEGRKAAVFLGTMLGHFPWAAPRGQENDDGSTKLKRLARSLDGLFGHLLEKLEAARLDEDVLLLVVGDHGLRYAEEFHSVGRKLAHDNRAFNVPFLLYAPGLTDTTVRIPWPTSHVDITPTLLHLVGIQTKGMLHHGGYILDAGLGQRAILLLNAGLRPVDGILFKQHYITHNGLTDFSQVGDGADLETYEPLEAMANGLGLPMPLRAPGALLKSLNQNFEHTIGAVRKRGLERAPQQYESKF